VVLSFHGKRTATEIAKRVRPCVTRRVADFSVGTPEEQSRNMIVEGENLQAMATLYKNRGQIDLSMARTRLSSFSPKRPRSRSTTRNSPSMP
jgi:hypothetical protein